ncbi:MAG: Helicase associated domain protein [Mycobacteriales bacterium]
MAAGGQLAVGDRHWPDPDRIASRGYQQEALRAITIGLGAGGRGWIQAACGTGKTRVAIAGALELCPSGLVVVVCPSLALLAKWLSDWRALAGYAGAFAACSDEDVGGEELLDVADLPCQVSTDPDVIATWLVTTLVTPVAAQGASALTAELAAAGHGRGLRLVVTTYASAPRVGQALLTAGRKADLLVLDEAHHTAGPLDKHAAAVHDDERVPARRRLYMTATPRILSNRRRGDTAELLAMDNSAIYGDRMYQYSFRRGVAEGYLDDYRLVVIGVRRPDLLAWLRELDPAAATADPGAPTIHRMLAQAALGQAMRTYDLRSIIVFSPRIATAAEFARTLPATLRALPADRRPDCPLAAHHISGNDPIWLRQRRLTDLANTDNGAKVLANAKCLVEGVDVPAVDAVLFDGPRRSPVEIVQAVGRALRPHPAGSGTATIIVPLLLPDDPHPELDDLQGYDTVVQVVQALRAHDDTFAAALDSCRARGHQDQPDQPAPLPPQIVVQLPERYRDETFLQHLTTRVIRSATTTWPVYLALAAEYRRRHGDLLVPRSYEVAGLTLGAWINRQRRDYLHGLLPGERIAALDALDMAWNAREARWQERFKLLCAYRDRNGCLPAKGHVEQGVRLGDWLHNQRTNRARLASARKTLFAEHGISLDPTDTNQVEQERWQRELAAATLYQRRHGHLHPQGEETIALNGRTIRIGAQIKRWRASHRAGELRSEQIVALDALGMEWDPNETRWQECLAIARHFFTEHGHLRPPSRSPDKEIRRLYKWLDSQRVGRRKGTLSARRIAALDELGMVWEPHLDAWNDCLAAATEYYQTHGHLKMKPGGHKTPGGRDLGTWIFEQRTRHQAGRLTPSQIAALEAIGMIWRPAAYFDAARAYVERHGPLPTGRPGEAEPSGLDFRPWLEAQRAKAARGRLAPDRIAALNDLDPNWCQDTDSSTRPTPG